MNALRATIEPRISLESLRFSRRDTPKDVAPAPAKIQSCDKLHRFSVSVAESYGLGVAVVYQYLSWHCQNFGKWTGTKEKLLATFPYLTPKELRLVLSKMLGKVPGISALISRRGLVYTLNRRIRGGKFHTFDPKLAVAYGMLAAAVYDNVLYWVSLEDLEGVEEPCHYTSASSCQLIHPYASISSVERVFRCLQEAGELVIAGRHKGRIPVWTIPLGVGKLDRWYKFHQALKITPVSEGPKVRVPVLLDDSDLS